MNSPSTLSRWLVPLALLACAAGALAQADPPARAGSLSDIEGSVVFARAGATEWTQAALNRPITAGDRLWTDPGARADVHLGTAVLHIDSETFVEARAIDAGILQSVLHEGAVQARVRALAPTDRFEIDTPQLVFRALQPGSYRIDADRARRITRVSVRDGAAVISGRSGRTLMLYPGQQLEVAGTDLEQLASMSFDEDDFDRWAAARDSREDQSPAARLLPAEVVGASQLDSYGSWMRDPVYGVVWYPNGLVADWAPYRYGSWEWIRPWGWTWIDQAPWGFAPFHYGRWALIGSRWAWVPGRLGRHPVYAPALVAFVAGGTLGPRALRSGEGIAWYPLAPGEPWQPFFAATPAYLRRANQSLGGKAPQPLAQHRPESVTALRIEDFRSGEPVQRHWERAYAADLIGARPLAPPAAAWPRSHAVERTAAQPAATTAHGLPRQAVPQRVQPLRHRPAPQPSSRRENGRRRQALLSSRPPERNA